MLKFVRQGEAATVEDEWTAVSITTVTEPKESGEHHCSVCKTRRRSLERQTAQVLRRSRSRETLRSTSNGSSTNDEDNCTSETSNKSQDASGMQGEGGARDGGGWTAKRDKYRRLSRSCEALSVSKKGTRWRKDDEDASHSKKGSLCRVKPGKAVTFGEKHIDVQENSRKTVNCEKHESSIFKDIKVNRLAPCTPTVATDCKTMQLSGKETRYTHDVQHDGDDQSSKTLLRLSGSEQANEVSPPGKQVQFAGVEYEKTREESVMGRLRNAVSSNRRKLRSRSLERIDRRGEWNREVRDVLGNRISRIGTMGRTRSKSWAPDELITKSLKSHIGESDTARGTISDCDNQQQRRYCKRSRSRSREDRTRADSETRQRERNLYLYDDNQNVLFYPRDEHLSQNGRRATSDPKFTMCNGSLSACDEVYDLQYHTPSGSENCHQSDTRQVVRSYHLKSKDETNTMISPKYMAPNGHYGDAVIRKCHREAPGTKNTKPSPGGANVKVSKLEVLSQKGHADTPSEQKTKNLNSKANMRRSSLPKLEKCGISAKKIAKLDTPLQFNAPNLNIISNIIEAPTISITPSADAESTPDNLQNQDQSTSSKLSRGPSSGEEPGSSGYVYNCRTARITKLNPPTAGKDCEQVSEPKKTRSEDNPQNTCSISSKLTQAEGNTNQESCLEDMRKIEPANNLLRQASVASLSLISVNSVDSGTSCQEGSTTDSSSSSSSASDKEMEVQAKTHAFLKRPVSGSSSKLVKEAREYTASAKQLEHLILASCFGSDKPGAGLVTTSDYESDTGPDMARIGAADDGRRRRGGVSRVVRFVGGKSEMDASKELKRRGQQGKPKGQPHSSQKSAVTIKHRLPESSASGPNAKLTARARVLHSHKALSTAEMSVHQGDVVYLSCKDFAQRPLWVMAYSSSSGEMGLIPSVYLADSRTKGLV